MLGGKAVSPTMPPRLSSQLDELVPLLKSPSATFSSSAAPGFLGGSVMVPTEHPRHDSRGRGHSGIISTAPWTCSPNPGAGPEGT